MAVPRKNKAVSKIKQSITKSDIKLIICVVVFAISVLLKYSDAVPAQELRVQVAGLLHGGADAGEVIEVIGRNVRNNDVLAVFSSPDIKSGDTVQTPDESKKASESKPTTEETQNTLETPVYAEDGYSEDLEDRVETLFPKEADETTYIMDFPHIQPAEATLSSDFGTRTHPISGKISYHFGLDMAAPKGTPILSFADGTVREDGNGSYGNYLIVDHADGFSTLYAHCDKLIAKKGESVKIGQEIAQVGATGNTTGNHLHFEIWRDGKALNPNHYIID